MSRPWDLLVVGAGSAGLTGARTAAALGARVLLVERDRFGGECLWAGCVPSKALLAAGAAAAAARAGAALGVDAAPVRVRGAGVAAHVRGAVAAVEPVDAPEALRAAGVVVERAPVRLTGPRTARVGDRELAFGAALLATGSAARPLALPAAPGAVHDLPAVVTTDGVWDLPALPDPLVVVGGGPASCELAQGLARLGCATSLVVRGPRLLPGEDPAAAELVTAALRADGVAVHRGRRAAALAPSAVVLDDGQRLPAAVVLAAVGRAPRTEGLGLGAAGVALGPEGHVAVDASLRTSNPRVFAAGDVTALSHHTHTAGAHASTAAANAVLGTRRRVSPVVPRVVFTDPEVAVVERGGAGGRRDGGRVLHVDARHVDRAVADGRTDGFTRLVTDRRGRLVAATVVGPRAGEVLAELSLAVQHRMRPRDLAATTHAYPTHADGVWAAAVEDVRAGLRRPVVRALLRTAVVLRRARPPRHPAA